MRIKTLAASLLMVCAVLLSQFSAIAQPTLQPAKASYLNSGQINGGTFTVTGTPTQPGAIIQYYQFYISSITRTFPSLANVPLANAQATIQAAGWSHFSNSGWPAQQLPMSFSLDSVYLSGVVVYTFGGGGLVAQSFSNVSLAQKITASSFNFGTINGAGKTQCASANVGTISQTVAPRSSVNPMYQWYSIPGAVTTLPSGIPAVTTGFTAIPGATSATYNPGTSVTATTTFARTATVTDPTINWTMTGWSTNTFVVTVSTPPTFTAGSITARRDSFCYVSNAPIILQNARGTVATGSTERLRYQWFVRDGLFASAPTGANVPSGWNAISGATDSIYDPPTCNYTSRTYARRVRTSHTCSGWQWSTGTAQTIIKTNCVTWGAIDRTSQTICDMGDPFSFQVTFNSTNFRADSATWQWYYKDGLQSAPEPDDVIGSWQWITYYPQRTNSYDPPAGLHTSRTYACRVTLINPVGYAPGRYTKWARCAAQVLKLDPVQYGTLSGNQTSCWGAAPTGIALSNNPSGGTGQFQYQWYYTSGFYGPTQGITTGWTAVPGATNPALTNAPVLYNHATFACMVTPVGMPHCGDARWANGQVYVNVTGTPTDFGSLGWTNQHVNSNGDPTAFTFSRNPNSNAGPFLFQWYYKPGYASAPGNDDPIGTWQPIVNANNAVYDPPRYPTQTLTYAVRVTLTGLPMCGTKWAEGSRTVVLNNGWSGGGMGSNGGDYGVVGYGRVSVAPNPFVTDLTLRFNAPENDHATLMVLDISGKTVMNLPVEVNQGENEYSTQALQDLKPGVYMLRMLGNNATFTQRVVKQ